eukprot:646057-Karenia_brevis.AAC.1
MYQQTTASAKDSEALVLLASHDVAHSTPLFESSQEKHSDVQERLKEDYKVELNSKIHILREPS